MHARPTATPRSARPRRGLHTLMAAASDPGPPPSQLVDNHDAPLADDPGAISVREASCKGFGVFARRNIDRGECVISEPPILEFQRVRGEDITHHDISKRVRSLRAAEREAFWSLHQNVEHGAVKTAYGIWISNSFPTDATTDGTNSVAHSSAAVFRLYSRLNHACVPNVHGCWNARLGKQTVYTLRAIDAGEELTADYLGACGVVRNARQRSLFTDMGFGCVCSLCSLEGAPLQASEQRQARIGELHAEISAHHAGAIATAHSLRPDANRSMAEGDADVIGLVEERLSLMEAEGMLPLAWDTLWAASEACELRGDAKAAGRWARQAAECARLALGVDSDEVEQYERRAVPAQVRRTEPDHTIYFGSFFSSH